MGATELGSARKMAVAALAHAVVGDFTLVIVVDLTPADQGVTLAAFSAEVVVGVGPVVLVASSAGGIEPHKGVGCRVACFARDFMAVRQWEKTVVNAPVIPGGGLVAGATGAVVVSWGTHFNVTACALRGNGSQGARVTGRTI